MGVLVVADVLVFPSSAVVEMCEALLSDSDREFVESQSFSFSKKRSFVCVENQEDMSYEGTPLRVPPTSRRRMMSPTPQQISHSSIEVMQWQTEMQVQGSGWHARDREIIAKMEQYLNDSDCVKLEIEELELLLGPEDSEVDLRHILMIVSRRGGRICEIFSSKEKSEHFVASKVRWDERQRLKAVQEEKA